MRPFVCALVMVIPFISSCNRGDKSELVFPYSGTEAIYIQAMKKAKSDNPQYFSDARKAGVEDKIVGLQVLALRGECVLFVNKSRVIIHKTLPLYCFDYKNGSFIGSI